MARITFLGTKGNIEESRKGHRKHTSILIRANRKKILVDWGESFSRREFLDIEPHYLVLTHRHPDHVGGLLKLREEDLRNVVVYCTQDVLDWIMENEVPVSKVKVFDRRQRFKIGDFIAESYPVSHSYNAPNILLKIRVDGDWIAIATDFLWCRSWRKALKNVRVWIGDGSSPTRDIAWRPKGKDRVGHMSMIHQLDMLKKAGVPIAIFVHLGKSAVKMKDKELLEILEKHADGIRVIVPTPDIAPIIPKVTYEPVKTGIYLVPPHARLIAEGKKKLIVKTRAYYKHVGEPLLLIEDGPLLLIEDGLAYGIIEHSEPEEITWDEFWELEDKHRISREEVEKWNWSSEDKLYAYRVRVVEVFDEPRPVRLPRGVQTYVDVDNIEFLSVSQLEDSELEKLHAW